MESISDCIFCKIISGQIKTQYVAQTQYAVAILDAFPLTPGHTLVIPRTHVSKIQEATADHLAGIFELAGAVASGIERGLGVEGSLVAVHNGKVAGQEIPHLHVHIVPRRPNDGGGPIHSIFKQRDKVEGSMESICSKISSSLPKVS